MKVLPVLSVGCPYCGAKAGQQCLVTLSENPEQTLSVLWAHRSRERQFLK